MITPDIILAVYVILLIGYNNPVSSWFAKQLPVRQEQAIDLIMVVDRAVKSILNDLNLAQSASAELN